MSIRWITGHVGYDGDSMYGTLTVDRGSRDDFEAELDKQLAHVRAGMLAEATRLMADDWRIQALEDRETGR